MFGGSGPASFFGGSLLLVMHVGWEYYTEVDSPQRKGL